MNWLLIDGSSALHRALHVPEVWDLMHNGHRTGGVHGFLMSLAYTVREFGTPTGLLVAWDQGISAHRSALFPDYKKNRVSKTGEAIKFRNKTGKVRVVDRDEFLAVYGFSRTFLHQEVLPLAGIISVQVPNVEADDILAQVSFWLEQADPGSRQTIISTDRDLWQLLRENVTAFNPIKRTLMTREKLVQEWGLDPDRFLKQFLLTKALAGDKSDGVPGVPGVGETTGAEIARLLLDAGDWSRLNPKSKRHTAVMENWGLVHRNIQLVDLRRLDAKSIAQVKAGVSQRLAAPSENIGLPDSLTERLDFYGLRQSKAELFSIHHRLQDSAKVAVELLRHALTFA